MEWRRSRRIYGKIDYFILYYKSLLDDSYYKRKIDISASNTSDLYLVSVKGLYSEAELKKFMTDLLESFSKNYIL